MRTLEHSQAQKDHIFLHFSRKNRYLRIKPYAGTSLKLPAKCHLDVAIFGMIDVENLIDSLLLVEHAR